MGRMQYKRRSYFVKREFQLKYIGMILAVMLLTLIIAGYSIYYNSWILLGARLANVYPQGRLVQIFRYVNLRLFVNMFFVTMLCTGIAIIASHKIAGPIYRMLHFVNDIAAGNYSQRLVLRKGDELNELAGALNKLAEKLESEKKS